MIYLAASLLLFALFFLIGSLELRGRVATKHHAFTRPTLLAAIATLGLTALTVSAQPVIFATMPESLLALLTAFTALMVVIILLDVESQMLSDALTVLLALGGLAFGYIVSIDTGDMWPRIGLGAALGLLGWFLAGPYSKWRGQDMLGWGDVKFFAAAGLWLDPAQLPIFLAAAGLIGAINALIYKIKTGRAETPFAPALCFSLWICVVYNLTLAA